MKVFLKRRNSKIEAVGEYDPDSKKFIVPIVK